MRPISKALTMLDEVVRISLSESTLLIWSEVSSAGGRKNHVIEKLVANAYSPERPY